jgi:hypothetical protein
VTSVVTRCVALLALLSASSVAAAQRPADSTQSILGARGDSVRVKLLDVASARVIANAEVELWSDNGVRCYAAPCRTGDRKWNGRSDSDGYVVIPTTALQVVTSIRTAASYGDLIEDSAPDGAGGWVAELLPRDTSDTEGPQPIKLIDRRSGKPIANAIVRIEYRSGETRLESMMSSSNGLGYMFVPIAIVEASLENCWIVVPGYRRAHVDFGWAGRKMELERP